MAQSTMREFGPEAAAEGMQAAVSSVVVATCIRAFGERLRGIILTGSLARLEGTFVRDAAGWKALGDAEFFVVFEQRCALPGAAQTESVRQQAERTLVGEGVHCHIDLSPVHPGYLQRLQPHILAYELRECGQVVWGDAGLLSLIPQFPASALLREDAWRLLCNRMVEYLEVAADLLQPGRPLPAAVMYRTVKLYLDMATSLLVFAGEYEPTYGGRAARLRSLAAAPRPGMDLPFPLDAFAERVALCTAFKLREPGYREEDAAAFQAERFWRDAIDYARRLWRWELCRLTGVEGLSDRDLMREWMRRQPMHLRLRGWASILRRCGWAGSWRYWPRWIRLVALGTPRYCVYATAAELCFGLREGQVGKPADWKELQSWLPLVDRDDMRPLGRRKLCDEVATNYHRLLETTCA